MPTPQDWLERFRAIRQWRRKGERAPHKPLLILLALGDIQLNAERLHTYPDIDQRLGSLLRRFGPPTPPSPQYPFVRLANDQVWETPGIDQYRTRKSNTDPPRSALMEGPVQGGFPAELHDLLTQDPQLLSSITNQLLEQNFPPSMHPEILEAVGLDLTATPSLYRSRRTPRDPSFRPRVLQAYEQRCAICRLDTRMDGIPFLLEAAHIRWHNMDGPDEVTNGLSLCVLHHKALDRGALGLTTDHRILISQDAIGGDRHTDALLQFHGTKLTPPQDPSLLPAPAHIEWHTAQVFRSPARVLP